MHIFFRQFSGNIWQYHYTDRHIYNTTRQREQSTCDTDGMCQTHTKDAAIYLVRTNFDITATVLFRDIYSVYEWVRVRMCVCAIKCTPVAWLIVLVDSQKVEKSKLVFVFDLFYTLFFSSLAINRVCLESIFITCLRPCAHVYLWVYVSRAFVFNFSVICLHNITLYVCCIFCTCIHHSLTLFILFSRRGVTSDVKKKKVLLR